MSVDPQMMAQLLMQRGQQQPGMAGVGGQPAQAGGANLLQQILAMQQLKQRLGQVPPPQPGMAPGMPNMPPGPPNG